MKTLLIQLIFACGREFPDRIDRVLVGRYADAIIKETRLADDWDWDLEHFFHTIDTYPLGMRRQIGLLMGWI